MFWERFFQLCNDAGTKPNPVGKEIQVSSGVITKWKNEKTLPNGETLLKIANYFNVSVDYLLGRTDIPEVGGVTKEYKGLNALGQQKVQDYISDLLNSPKYCTTQTISIDDIQFAARGHHMTAEDEEKAKQGIAEFFANTEEPDSANPK